MINKILLAYDGSESAAHAAGYAQEIALKFGASVKIVYAFHKISRVLGNTTTVPEIEHETAKGIEIAGGLADKMKAAGVNAEADALEGPPEDAILRAAEANEIDLIVMGTRGKTGIFAGSVSEKVLHAAKCPVLITR